MRPPLRLALISDTHGAHDALRVPDCDVLVHAGDLCHRGTKDELARAFAWMAAQPAQARVAVPGNHERWAFDHPEAAETLAAEFGVHWLVDRGVQLDGRAFWGSPWTPLWRNGAYMQPKEQLFHHWQCVPAGVDVLITHGPPHGIGDRTLLGLRVGCQGLRAAVRARQPALHVFGHIHEARGDYTIDGCPTQFVNAASRRLLVPGVHPVRVIALA